jgi:hypothetical protein
MTNSNSIPDTLFPTTRVWKEHEGYVGSVILQVDAAKHIAAIIELEVDQFNECFENFLTFKLLESGYPFVEESHNFTRSIWSVRGKSRKAAQHILEEISLEFPTFFASAKNVMAYSKGWDL